MRGGPTVARVSTPPGPQQPDPSAGQPYHGPYGTGYGGAQYGTPPPGQQSGQRQYGAPAQPYADYPYSPYGSAPFPAGLDGTSTAPVARPGIMILALVLMILSAVPFLVFGALFLMLPIAVTDVPPAFVTEIQRIDPNLAVEDFILGLRVIAGVALALAVPYVTFAVFAFLGHNWARILVTVMTAGFAVTLVLLTGGALDALLVSLPVIVLSVAGAVLLFVPPSARYFSAIRR